MRKSGKKIGAVAFSVIIFLLALEAGIRLSGKFATLSEKNGHGFLSLFSVTNEGSIYTHKPGLDIHIRNTEFSYVHRIDSLGFRNDSPDASSFSILALGDSFTEGLGAPQDSTWPALLGKRMGTGVYNAGIMGSDPVYGYKLLTQDYFPFRPKQIVFAVNFSDVTDMAVRGGEERFMADGRVRYRREPWFMPLYRNIHLFRAFLHLGLRYDYMFNSPREREINIRMALDTLTGVLARTDAWCSSRNIRLKVCVHPVPQEYYMNMDRRLDFRRVDTLVPMLMHRGVDAVNLRPAFEARLRSPEDWKTVSWPLDGHFNAKGYALMADLIGKEIRKDTLVMPPAH